MEPRIKQIIEAIVGQILYEIDTEEDTISIVSPRGKYHKSHGSDERFWGDAGAGILVVCKTTGRILLTFRSQMVNEPNTWGIPGGKIDGNEPPKVAARRELQEELGFSNIIDVIPAYVFSAGNFKFYNFIGVVLDEFEPTLNWENEKAEWFDISNLPTPLHFGVKALLRNSKALIEKIIESHSD